MDSQKTAKRQNVSGYLISGPLMENEMIVITNVNDRFSVGKSVAFHRTHGTNTDKTLP